MNIDIDDIQFCDNTATEAAEAKAQVQAIIDTLQARIEKLTEYPERLQKAITELEAFSPTSQRILGKIEGVKLALGYFEEMNR